MTKLNEIELSQKLIQFRSYSGYHFEVIKFLGDILQDLGFKCDYLDFEGDDSYKVNNLHAIYNPNNSDKIIYFAGHTDVVNEGDINKWQFEPFSGIIKDDKLYGRGASDMKCAIACFVVSVVEFLQKNKEFDFGIGFLITNDEEADGINGTKKVLEWMDKNNHKMTHCIVGEPTNPEKFGEMIKIGRRGSVNFELKITGKQGHVAYPQNALNPITTLVDILKLLKEHKFDEGNEFFDATNLEVVNIESQNLGSNVIPEFASAKFNVRFNDIHNSQDIINLVDYACKKSAGGDGEFSAKYQLKYRVSGESFITKSEEFSDLVIDAVKKITNLSPKISTTGGTSDARFIKDYAKVIEIGLVNKTAHKIDEFSCLFEITNLRKTYYEILCNFNK